MIVGSGRARENAAAAPAACGGAAATDVAVAVAAAVEVAAPFAPPLSCGPGAAALAPDAAAVEVDLWAESACCWRSPSSTTTSSPACPRAGRSCGWAATWPRPSQPSGRSSPRRTSATGPAVKVRRKLAAVTVRPISRLASVLLPVPVPPISATIGGASPRRLARCRGCARPGGRRPVDQVEPQRLGVRPPPLDRRPPLRRRCGAADVSSAPRRSSSGSIRSGRSSMAG